jgi:ATP-dependent exoDNAse (exonuclease V) beta subunit
VGARYAHILERAGALDFDDLLIRAVALLQQNEEVCARYRERFQYLLVDEYQDTNRTQYDLVRLLAGGHGNLTVVGDEDQSIYSWRGADIRNILDFEADFPGARVLRLEENYRSTQAILDAASGLVAHNRARKGKTLRATKAGGRSSACTGRATSTRRPPSSSRRSRPGAGAAGGPPCSSARTPRAGSSRKGCCASASPTWWWAGSGSTSARKCGTCSRTSA